MLTRRRFLVAAAATPLLAQLLAACDPLFGDSDPPGDLYSTQGYGTNPVITKPVLLDQNINVSSLRVTSAGALIFDPNASRKITSTGNIINEGWLEMRPSGGVTHEIQFTGVNEGAFVGGGMDPISSDVGYWTMGAGINNIKGTPKSAWVRAFSTVAQSATSATLNAVPTGWLAGDTIAIVPTQQDPHQYDIRTLSTTPNSNTIQWSSGTTYPHPVSPWMNAAQTVRYGAEILNLTRNVKIGGTSGGRSHMFIRSTQPQSIFGVELRYMGPQKSGSSVLGRYPLHFHHCMNNSDGSKVQECVARDSGGHGFVSHFSNGIWYQDCIGHDIQAQVFWWDHPQFDPDSASNGITYSHCVASHATQEGTSQYKATGFEQNLGTNIHTQSCVAVGIYGPDAAGYRWDANEEAVWDHHDNQAHSCAQGIVAWQNDDLAHTVINDDIWACDTGVNHGAYGNAYVWTRLRVAGCNTPIHIQAVNIGAAPGTPGQTWDGLFVDGGGHSMQFPDGRPVPPGGPTIVKNSTFKSPAGAFLYMYQAEGADEGAVHVVATSNNTFIGGQPHTGREAGSDTRSDIVSS